MSKKIAMSLEETLKVMDRRHQAERDREITKVCSKDLRRWILIGNFLREKRSEKIKEIEVAILADPEFDSFIKLDIDRELFGLGPRKKEEKNKTKTDVKSSVPQSESSTATANEGTSIATETDAMPEVKSTAEAPDVVTPHPADAMQSSENMTISESNEMQKKETDQRVYLTSEFKEQEAIKKTFDSIFGKNRRGLDWDFDKTKNQWFFFSDDEIDTTPLKKWLPDKTQNEMSSVI